MSGVLATRKTRSEQAAPAATELDEMMLLEEPVQETTHLDRGTEQQFAGMASRITSPEAQAAHRNYVEVIKAPLRTLYDDQGDGRQVFHSDVPALVDEGLHVRCPKCRYMDRNSERAELWATDKNGSPIPGIHRTIGVNACPGREPLMWMACRLCSRRIYEDPKVLVAAGGNADADEYMVEDTNAATEKDRKERLVTRRNTHEVSFHEGEALQLYGLKRTDYRRAA